MEIVKLRMQLQGESGVKLSAGATVAELGLRGLFRGVTACWLRDIPFSFIFFPLFAHLKKAFSGNDSIVGLFAAGGVAGALAAGAVTPCDVIKTRLQVKGGDLRYTGIADCARKLLKEEGIAAFSKGLVPRMIVQAPLFGCTLLSYGKLGLDSALAPFQLRRDVDVAPTLVCSFRSAEVLKAIYRRQEQ